MSQLLSFTGTCEARLDSNNSGNTIPLLSVPQILSSYQELRDEYYLAVDFRLESLRGEISLLESFQQAPFPNFYPEDSAAKKLEKKFEIDQKYPSVGLEILKRSDAGNLIRLSEILLQNKGSVLHSELRMPYLGTGDVKLMGEIDELFIRLNDKGYGVISSSNDYLQIEGDYSCIISGFKRKKEAALKYSTKDLLAAGLLVAEPPRIILKWNNSVMKYLAQAIKDLGYTSAHIDSGVSSLVALEEVRTQLRSLTINNADTLSDSAIMESILGFVNLTDLRLYHTPRKGLDFRRILQSFDLHYFSVYSSELVSSQIDVIITTLDEMGKTYGVLDIRRNSSPTTASQAAKNNLIAKNWNILE